MTVDNDATRANIWIRHGSSAAFDQRCPDRVQVGPGRLSGQRNPPVKPAANPQLADPREQTVVLRGCRGDPDR